jgi:hypothetical protein
MLWTYGESSVALARHPPLGNSSLSSRDASAREIAAALQVNTTLKSLTLGSMWRDLTGCCRPDVLGETVKKELREVWGARQMPMLNDPERLFPTLSFG